VPSNPSTVEVTLEPDGAGTLLRLVHRGLLDPGRAPFAGGWEKMLPRPADAVTRGELDVIPECVEDGVLGSYTNRCNPSY
jgi:hypothetical protein